MAIDDPTRGLHICSNCRFWDGDGPGEDGFEYGYCKIKPPVIVINRRLGQFPRTHAGEWCGCWILEETHDGD